MLGMRALLASLRTTFTAPGRRAQQAIPHLSGVFAASGTQVDSGAMPAQPTAYAWWAAARKLAASLQDQRRLAWVLTLLLVVGDVLIVGQHAIGRHYAFHSYAFDLGNMDQAVWNTLHGHPFRFTNRGIDWFGPPTRLAIHVEPILLLIAPLYLIHSGAETLLALQTVALALGALPVLALSLRWLPAAPLLGVVFAAAYLAAPELLGEAMFDFHPVTLATPLLLLAVLALDARRYGLFLVAAMLAAACKEDVALALVPLGLYIALRQGRTRFGLLVAAGAIVWTALCFLVIMPHFNQGISGGGNAYWYRYLALGTTPRSALKHLLLDPFLLVPVLFTIPKLGYLALLLRTGGGLGILAPLWWLGALPELAINLLSSQDPQFSGFYHYNAITLPLLIVAAIAGTALLYNARVEALAGRAPGVLGKGTASDGAARATAGRPYDGKPVARIAATSDGAARATAGRPYEGPLAKLQRVAGRGLQWAADQLDRLLVAWRRWLGRVPLSPRMLLVAVGAWLLISAAWNLAAIQPKLHGFWNAASDAPPAEAQMNALLARIPAGAVVAATDTLDPHLTDRETIYLMPDPASYQAQYVAVDMQNLPTNVRAADAAMFASMASSPHYRLVGAAGSLVVLQRIGAPLVTAAP
jgi:uncharacterized membrane protein